MSAAPDPAGITRRDALRRLGLAAGALGVAPALASCGGRGSDAQAAGEAAGEAAGDEAVADVSGNLGPLGVQLYTVREAMAADVAGTLARVAQIGYQEVEFAGYFDRAPEDVRALLDAAGLRAPAAHVDVGALRDDPGPILEAAHTIGHEWVVVAWMPESMRASLDDWRRTAASFNEIGAAARDAGLRFGYHNHDFEIPPMEGRMPLDVLLEETDPDLVDLELDLFWITHGGADPVAFLERWPGRVKMVHVKDRTSGGEMVDVGAGLIDFPSIFAHREQAGIRHLFVEHDQPGDAFASIAASYRHLSAMRA